MELYYNALGWADDRRKILEHQPLTAEVAENWRFVEDIEMWAKKRIRETQDEVCL